MQESTNLPATEPAPPPGADAHAKQPMVFDAIGIVSQGRLSFSITDHLVYMYAARLGIAVTPAWGALWDKNTQNKMEQLVDSGAKYLMFFDGDGAWSMEDMRELYDIIDNQTLEDGSPIDAVFPVQADRGSDVPLAYQWLASHFTDDGKPFDYSTRFTKVVHGHFGLTLIRCEALKRTPLPWLRLKPGQNGSYHRGTPGQMDPDTYFWWKFAEKGNTVVQANTVVIGHIELCVRWQRGTDVYCQSINEYMNNPVAPEDLRIASVDEYVAAGKADQIGHRMHG